MAERALAGGALRRAVEDEVRAGDVVTVRIESIAGGGAGVGRLPDGRALFVHRTAPNEEARVRVVELRARWGRGELVSILAPGPVRREAPCPHYARGCGGCTLEHLHYAAQLEAKGRIVADALERIGGVDDVRSPTVTASPKEFRYRNRVTFTMRRLRGGRIVSGFHALERPGRILDIDGHCLLFAEPIADVWDRLRERWGKGAQRLPAGGRLRLTLRLAGVGGPVILLVEGGDGDGDPEALLQDVDGLAAIWRVERGGGRRLLAADEVKAPPAFEQVNPEAARLLTEAVVGRAGVRPGERVVDAYCGAGVYGWRLAALGARVVGIESDPAAVALARSGPPEGPGEFALQPAADQEAAPVGSGGFTAVEGRVEDELAAALPADIVILNPPRTGLDDEVPGILNAGAREGPLRRLLYVSCDPATLARDVKRLSPRFALEELLAFDLFPQTAHVETVAHLVAREEE